MAQNTALQVIGVSPRRIGGAEEYAREISLQLAEKGWESVLCFSAPPPPQVRDYLALPNVRLESIDQIDYLGVNPARALSGLLRRYKPRVLHLQFTSLLNFYGLAAALHGVEKMFFTDQQSRPAGFRALPASLLKRTAFKTLDHNLTGILGISEYNCRCLRTIYPHFADRIHLVYNAVPLHRVTRGSNLRDRFRRRFQIPADAILFIQISWIRPEKGIEQLLRAFAQVAEEEPRARLLIAGDGSHRDEYNDLITTLGLRGKAVLAGLLKDPMAEGLFAAADVSCQMSQWEEGFGWVIAEAMAHSLPVVGTRSGGIPEVINHLETGFVGDRTDIDGLAAYMLELAQREDLRREMGAAGRRRVERMFNLRQNTAQVLDLYGLADKAQVPVPASAPVYTGVEKAATQS